MVNHTGFYTSGTLASIYKSSSNAPTTPLNSFFFGTHTPVITTPIIEEHNGFLHSKAVSIIEHCIYVSPLSFELGLITENTYKTMSLWNASQEMQYLIDIIIDGQQGIILEGLEPPYQIMPETILCFDLTILETGKPQQDTTITFTFQEHPPIIVQISGNRIIGFPYLANTGDFTLDYNFETTIWNSDRFKEQRRSLTDKFTRSLSAGFLYQDEEQKQLLRFLADNYNKVLAIPCYNEPLFFSGDIQNQSIIALNDSTEFLDNLEEATYCVIIDNETHISEVKEILYYTSDTIVFSNNVLKYFNFETSAIFPAFLGLINEKNIGEIVSSFSQTDLTFKEIFI
jgi:hypothetical protein